MVKIVASFLALLPVAAWPTPFLITDPVAPQVTHCGYYLDDGARVLTPVFQDGASKICKVDIGAATVGAHTARLTAIVANSNGVIWGESEKSAPFGFTKPELPPPPVARDVVQ